MKTRSKEIIEDEEYGLKQLKDELNSLKSKWIKIPHTLRLIEFLEYSIKQKENCIEKIRNFKEEVKLRKK